jgi:ribosome modulation factor
LLDLLGNFDIEAGETNLSWEDWCARNIALSRRQIDRFIASATRIRSGRRIRLLAALKHKAYDEGMAAYLEGFSETRCPYITPLYQSAWYLGWQNMRIRQRTQTKPDPLNVVHFPVKPLKR